MGYTDGTTTASYTYRPNGLRNTKTVGTNTERYIWVGDQVSLICDGNNLVKDKYAYGNRRISRETTEVAGETLGTRSNYMYNGHGDVMGLTDSTGEVTETYDYDAFGMESMTVSSSTNPFRYAGEMWDSTTNTYYLRARNYAPKIGRFTTEDPAQDGLNWYAYCNNNPIMFVDPSGMYIVLDGLVGTGDIRVATLQQLTDDRLWVEYDYDHDKSYVYYYENKNAKRMAGTSLVRRVIDHKNMCTIISVDGTGTDVWVNEQDSQNPAKGSYARIEVDFNSPENYWVNNNGKYEKQRGETYIEMGHELIHALRAMNGNMKHYIDGTYGSPWKNSKTRSTDAEELDTIGINYFGSDGGYYPASTWAMTENALRRENGLPPRVDYEI